MFIVFVLCNALPMLAGFFIFVPSQNFDTMLLNLEHLREDYSSHTLDISSVNQNPFLQFESWFNEAQEAQVLEPNAMTLSTCDVDGQPSSRIVLLKGVEKNAFHFYTNYNSRKGQQIDQNPKVALLFLWLELHRQVRIEGVISKLPPEQSTQYFQSRPRGSQIGAIASPQSEVIASREVLEDNVKELEKRYNGIDKMPRPVHWGGYLVIPHLIEFWQGRPSRLHDRIQYTLIDEEKWKLERLAP